MNIYDFDGTIYDGDSSIDFYKFCISKKKRCLFIIPGFIISVIFYKLKLKSKEDMKSKFFAFFKYFDNIESVVDEFWKKYERKIKPFYLKQKNATDIVISASPDVLLKPMEKKLGFKLVSTKIDIKNGRLIGKNCHGSEKVNRLKEMGITHCKAFYSDSMSDDYCAKIADEAFLVKGSKILPWPKA